MGSNMFNDDEVRQLLELVKKIDNFHQLDIKEKLMKFVEIARILSHKKERAKTGSQVRYKLEQLRKAHERGKEGNGTRNRHALKYHKLLDEIFGVPHEKKKNREEVESSIASAAASNIKEETINPLLLCDSFVIKEECDEAEIEALLSKKQCIPTTDGMTTEDSEDEMQQKMNNGNNKPAEVNDNLDIFNKEELENMSEEDIKGLEKIKSSFTTDLVESERVLIDSIKELDKKYMRNFKHHCKSQEALLKKDRDEMEILLNEDRQEMSKIFDAALNALGNTNSLQNGTTNNINSTLSNATEVVKTEPASFEYDNKALEMLLLHLIEQYKRKRAALQRNLLKTHHELLRTMTQERRTKLRQICVVHNKVAQGFVDRNVHIVRNLWIDKHPRCDFFWQTLQQPENEILFFETFRMTKKTFDALCDKIAPHLPPHTNPLMLPTPVDKQVAITLYKLASGAKFDAVTDAFSIVKSTARIYFDRVVKAILQLKAEYVQFPQTEEAILVANGFQKITKMPNIFGILSDIHFLVVPPNNLYYHFLNGKGCASVVLQSVVDHNLFFRDACVKPGSTTSRIFQESDLFTQASTLMPSSSVAIANGVDLPLMLLGDDTYPLLPFLLKPYTEDIKDDEKCFNFHLNAGLSAAHSTYRRLKGRWRCLSKRLDAQRDMKVEILPSVVLACVILHNFVEKSKEEFFDSWAAQIDQANTESLASPKTYNNEIKFETNFEPSFLRDNLKIYLNKNFPLKGN